MTCGHLTCLECYNALWAHARERGRSSPTCPFNCEVRDFDVEMRHLTDPVRPSSVIPSQSMTFFGDDNLNTTAVSNSMRPSSQYPSSPEGHNFNPPSMVTPIRPTSILPSFSQMNISEDSNLSATAVSNPIPPTSSQYPSSPQYSGVSDGDSFNSIKRDRSYSRQAIRHRNRRRYFDIF